MKKVLKCAAILLAVVMAFAMTTVVFADAEIDEDGNIVSENEPVGDGLIVTADAEIGSGLPAFGTHSGAVAEIVTADGEISYIVIESGDSVIHATIDYNTFFLGEYPEIGDEIIVFIDNFMPTVMIYPPRYLALAVINPEDEDISFALGRFDEDFVSSDNVWHLTMEEDTEILLQDGEEYSFEYGRMMLVEYIISARNIHPTTIHPVRIHVLFERAVPLLPDFSEEIGDLDISEEEPAEVEPIIEEDWSDFPVILNNQGVAGGDVYDADGGELGWPTHVALRPILEHLGIEPVWNGDTAQVSFEGFLGEVIITINSAEFMVGGEAISQPSAAIIVNDRTFVPIRFWRDVFGFANAYFEGGHMQIGRAHV